MKQTALVVIRIHACLNRGYSQYWKRMQ